MRIKGLLNYRPTYRPRVSENPEMTILAKRLFQGVLLRLREARSQRELFEKGWNEYLATTPWTFSLDSTSEKSHSLIGVEGSPVPDKLDLHFSIWLQQLRSALDNALHACVGANQGTATPSKSNFIEFPIFESERNFKSSKTIKNADLEERIVELLREYQPYKLQRLTSSSPPWTHEPADDPLLSPLYWLNELARRDRHRMMHVGVGSIVVPRNIRLIGGAEHTITYRHPDDEIFAGSTCLMKFETTSPLRYRKLKFRQKMELLPDIAGWINAQSLVHISSAFSAEGGYIAMRVPLKQRMKDVERLVKEICWRLGSLANLPPEFFSMLDLEDFNRRYNSKDYFNSPEAKRQRRINGL